MRKNKALLVLPITTINTTTTTTTNNNNNNNNNKHRGLQLSSLDRFYSVYVSWIRAFMCTPVTPTVPYMLTGLAECSVGLGISHDTRKLA